MGIVYLADVAGGCSSTEMDGLLKSFLPFTVGGLPKEALYNNKKKLSCLGGQSKDRSLQDALPILAPFSTSREGHLLQLAVWNLEEAKFQELKKSFGTSFAFHGALRL